MKLCKTQRQAARAPWHSRLAITSILTSTLLLLLTGCPSEGEASGDESDEATPVETANQPPVASAGDDQSVTAGDLVVLDGGASRDPDFDRLSFIWRQVAGLPAIQLQNAASSRPQFLAPDVAADVVFTFRLTIADGLATAIDEVSVTIRP